MLQVVEEQPRETDQQSNIYIGSQERIGFREDKYVFVDACYNDPQSAWSTQGNDHPTSRLALAVSQSR